MHGGHTIRLFCPSAVRIRHVLQAWILMALRKKMRGTFFRLDNVLPSHSQFPKSTPSDIYLFFFFFFLVVV